MSDQEIVDRWCVVFASNKLVERYLAGDQSVAELARATIELWRARLQDLSWFMRCLNEHIARKANAEDNCSGRFWEGRFKSQPLLDERALLAAMVYVDLNPIRAKTASRVLDCEFTGIYERIHGQVSSQYRETMPSTLVAFEGNAKDANSCVVPCTYDQYLELLDWSSRQIHLGKPGVVDRWQPPLLAQLKFGVDQWQTVCTRLGKVGHTALGSAARIAKFQQSRGMKKKYCNSLVTQLFA
ncbi:transposase [Salinibius halmophilus]|uniref:transposase n=1 Tax=Salinibius halmophilus TaxID=1853216 RepID=UPI001314C665|nr:transposase [Salinibius halmophilus]